MNYQPANIKPSPHVLVTRLRKHYPDVFKELVNGFQPLQHPFTLIEPLYKATDDRVLFFGAMIMLYGKYSDPLTMPRHHLHHGTGGYLVEVTGMRLPNVSNALAQAQMYFRVPGFREQVKQFIFDTVGITV